MKKIIKKFGLLALACVMFAQIIIPRSVQAEETTTPLGRITIHRFAGSNAATPTQGTALNGIPYRVELVRAAPGTPQTADALRNPENFEPITGESAYFRELSTVNGIADFTNLPPGIYLVTELPHTVTPENDRVAPFIVGIPRRGEDNTWIYEVDVYPKTDEDIPALFDKELELIWDENLGELVAEWTLETTIPRLIGNATRFEFIDPLNPNLTFIPNSVVGTYFRIQDIDGTPTPVAATLPANAFTTTMSEDNTLSIALTPAGFAHLSTNAILAPEGTLTFTFRTQISTDEADLGPITNAATLYYNDDEEGQETETPPPISYHFALEIEKIDVNGDRIGEATFELFYDEARTQPMFPDANGINQEFTTNDGIIFIPGLQAGAVYIIETQSPDGYRPNTGVMRVVISEGTTAEDRPFVVELQVVNEVEGGFILPETGGAGTIIFTVVGLALVGGAVTLAIIVKNRRRSHD